MTGMESEDPAVGVVFAVSDGVNSKGEPYCEVACDARFAAGIPAAVLSRRMETELVHRANRLGLGGKVVKRVVRLPEDTYTDAWVARLYWEWPAKEGNTPPETKQEGT
jgi:hypothetical protein